MSYVLFDKESTRMIGDSYRTMAAAKAAVTRRARKWAQVPANLAHPEQDPRVRIGIAERDHYVKNIERMVTRKNLMTGELYQESVNTPAYMSPAFESYWTM